MTLHPNDMLAERYAIGERLGGAAGVSNMEDDVRTTGILGGPVYTIAQTYTTDVPSLFGECNGGLNRGEPCHDH